MSDNNEQPKPSLPQNNTAASEQTVTAKSLNLLQIAGWFLGALLLISGAGAYYLWSFVNDTKASVEQKITNNKIMAANLTRTQSAVESKLNNKIIALSTLQSDLSKSVAALLAKSDHMRKDWLVSEAEYLVKLAMNRLILEDDIKTAITALNNADARLLEAGDPSLLLLRQEISNKLTELKALPVIDTSGMSIQISSVMQQIKKLPLVTPDPESFKQIQQSENNENHEAPIDWKEVTSRVISDVTNLIRIRKHDQIVQPLLSPEQRFFLVQNLKLQLEQARTALLHQQQKIYRERLTQTIVWINEYFDISKSTTKATLVILNKLNNKTLTQQMPDLSSALKMFNSFQAGIQLQKKLIKKAKPKAAKQIVIKKPKPTVKKVEPIIQKTPKTKEIQKSKITAPIKEKTTDENSLDNNTKKVPLIIPTKPGLAL
ncbi:hypothetical protein MNBD_GAMMA22-1621 [hydrothermal vent metagenome]|uniref:Uroporphyrinogen-III C-methyltransferase n=1 Tax=hydrothermal vent metagenome TaxID=652676 RepID=A0A3B1A569_9ZZZZ